MGGKETKVWHTVTTCTVTLKNKNLSHAPVYTMSREKVGLYALYMSTHGNMDGLFHGPHVSELKDPLEYDVPQELLDADPKFALLVEEANKRLALAETSVKRADENLRTANVGFSEGVITPTTVMEAQTAWLQAKSQLIDAEIDVRLSQVNMKKAMGALRAIE